MTDKRSIPIIDLFAGPGGLGEGFSSLRERGNQRFQIALSIEKDLRAHTTLRLRSFVRQFKVAFPDEYYSFLRDTGTEQGVRLQSLYDSYPKEAAAAESEAWQVELGQVGHDLVSTRIDSAIDGANPWVLIGGPPCQAYSLVGRSRNKGVGDYIADEDKRQYLYVEYLQVIAEHRPAVFVMENVKGLLSATVQNSRIFSRIVEDLTDPQKAMKREGRLCRRPRRGLPQPEYELFSLVEQVEGDTHGLTNFVVPMENHGIPQARHRLIIIGVRKDLLGGLKPSILKIAEPVLAGDVLDGLPRLRSGLSRTPDGDKEWLDSIHSMESRRWLKAAEKRAGHQTYDELCRALQMIKVPRKGRGGEFVPHSAKAIYAPDWYLDSRLEGVLNHATRGHIEKDLHRYLYCACFGKAHGRSPVLADFPVDLLPMHKNVGKALDGSLFADRFRVQLASRPSTTITSHISKDGHYYIHPDPTQCRSLTVREAARLQTFPDNYFFCGPRTSQYTQVGNAVPPLLANQIARIVSQFLTDSGATD